MHKYNIRSHHIDYSAFILPPRSFFLFLPCPSVHYSTRAKWAVTLGNIIARLCAHAAAYISSLSLYLCHRRRFRELQLPTKYATCCNFIAGRTYKSPPTRCAIIAGMSIHVCIISFVRARQMRASCESQAIARAFHLPRLFSVNVD